MTQYNSEGRTKAGTLKGSSGGGTTHPPMFENAAKYGVHHTYGAFLPTELRFRWQAGAGASDALYNIPSSIGAGPKKSFGTSTRDDWDLARKRADPGAGPGSYEATPSYGNQPSSDKRTAGSAAFDNAPRAPLNENTTPSPGPVYDLPNAMGRGGSGTKMGTSVRPPLHSKSVSPGPNLLLKGSFKESRSLVSTTFGTDVRLNSGSGSKFGHETRGRSYTSQTPGPIYDLPMTDFRTGIGGLSFTREKRFR